MKLIAIDIRKNNHFFCIVDSDNGEVLSKPESFKNNKEGFDLHSKDKILFGMEDTGHYHFALLKYLLNLDYTVALINPITTGLTRKLQGGISKNDTLDTLTICDVLSSSNRKKSYRISKINSFDYYEQKQLTRHHYNLKEELNIYMNVLRIFSSA